MQQETLTQIKTNESIYLEGSRGFVESPTWNWKVSDPNPKRNDEIQIFTAENDKEEEEEETMRAHTH